MNRKRFTNVFCMILCAITLIVGVVLPVPGSFAEEQYLNEASAEQLSVNYASPSNGAKYALTTLAGDKSEQEPEFYDVYRDDECTKLTDGIGTIGISENSVTFCGTAKTHRIKFDLSEKRDINNIVLYNVVMGSISQPQPYSSIKVTAGETAASVSDVEVNISEEYNGSHDSYDIILDFSTITARYVFITLSFPSYTVSLDEVGIYEKADSTLVYGDINGDGEIDSSDALVALKCDAGIVDLNEDQLNVADVNGDGAVDAADATMILKYDAGIIDEI